MPDPTDRETSEEAEPRAVPDGQERLATQSERDDVNNRIDRPQADAPVPMAPPEGD
jgi:hypothetical protein